MLFNETLYKRRSARSFTDKPVSTEQVEMMLDAAINAPSACNMQSWHFFAYLNADERAKFTRFSAPWVATAPVIFVICTDGEAITARFGERAKLFVIQDTALATENLLLSAADMGLNGCFIGAFDADKCREVLGIPEKYGIVALVPVGEPQIETPRRERKPLSEVTEIIGGELSQNSENPKPFTLRDASLPDAVFQDLNIVGASFDNINMANASFNDINMADVKFSDINMSGTKFGGLRMDRASFGCVDMKNARFENPDLSGTTFKNCNFNNVSLDGCKLDGLTIDGVNVTEALEFYKKNK